LFALILSAFGSTLGLMLQNVVKDISARQAAAAVNEWLVSYAGDRFLAGTPALDTQSQIWLVPILYVYPKEGPLGSVGEIAVNSVTGELSTHPPIEEIKRMALDLYRVKRGEDPTVLPSRD
jgi:hypothetical protein